MNEKMNQPVVASLGHVTWANFWEAYARENNSVQNALNNTGIYIDPTVLAEIESSAPGEPGSNAYKDHFMEAVAKLPPHQLSSQTSYQTAAGSLKIDWPQYWQAYEVALASLPENIKSEGERVMSFEATKIASAEIGIDIKNLEDNHRTIFMGSKTPEEYQQNFMKNIAQYIRTPQEAQAEEEKQRTFKVGELKKELTKINTSDFSGFIDDKTISATLDFVKAHVNDRRVSDFGDKYMAVVSLFVKIAALDEPDPVKRAEAIAGLLNENNGAGYKNIVIFTSLSAEVLSKYHDELFADTPNPKENIDRQGLQNNLIKPFQWLLKYNLHLPQLEQQQVDVSQAKQAFIEIAAAANRFKKIDELQSLKGGRSGVDSTSSQPTVELNADLDKLKARFRGLADSTENVAKEIESLVGRYVQKLAGNVSEADRAIIAKNISLLSGFRNEMDVSTSSDVESTASSDSELVSSVSSAPPSPPVSPRAPVSEKQDTKEASKKLKFVLPNLVGEDRKFKRAPKHRVSPTKMEPKLNAVDKYYEGVADKYLSVVNKGELLTADQVDNVNKMLAWVTRVLAVYPNTPLAEKAAALREKLELIGVSQEVQEHRDYDGMRNEVDKRNEDEEVIRFFKEQTQSPVIDTDTESKASTENSHEESQASVVESDTSLKNTTYSDVVLGNIKGTFKLALNAYNNAQKSSDEIWEQELNDAKFKNAIDQISPTDWKILDAYLAKHDDADLRAFRDASKAIFVEANKEKIKALNDAFAERKDPFHGTATSARNAYFAASKFSGDEIVDFMIQHPQYAAAFLKAPPRSGLRDFRKEMPEGSDEHEKLMDAAFEDRRLMAAIESVDPNPQVIRSPDTSAPADVKSSSKGKEELSEKQSLPKEPVVKAPDKNPMFRKEGESQKDYRARQMAALEAREKSASSNKPEPPAPDENPMFRKPGESRQEHYARMEAAQNKSESSTTKSESPKTDDDFSDFDWDNTEALEQERNRPFTAKELAARGDKGKEEESPKAEIQQIAELFKNNPDPSTLSTQNGPAAVIHAYRQIARYSIETIVDVIIKEPILAEAIFKQRIGTRLPGRRNFRKELAAHPELIEKLISSRDPMLLVKMSETGLLNTSHLNEHSRSRLMKYSDFLNDLETFESLSPKEKNQKERSPDFQEGLVIRAEKIITEIHNDESLLDQYLKDEFFTKTLIKNPELIQKLCEGLSESALQKIEEAEMVYNSISNYGRSIPPIGNEETVEKLRNAEAVLKSLVTKGSVEETELNKVINQRLFATPDQLRTDSEKSIFISLRDREGRSAGNKTTNEAWQKEYGNYNDEPAVASQVKFSEGTKYCIERLQEIEHPKLRDLLLAKFESAVAKGLDNHIPDARQIEKFVGAINASIKNGMSYAQYDKIIKDFGDEPPSMNALFNLNAKDFPKGNGFRALPPAPTAAPKASDDNAPNLKH